MYSLLYSMYILDSPLRSQDPRGGSDFLAPSRPRGRFLAFGGPLLWSVAAKKVILSSASFWQGLHFPVVSHGPTQLRFHSQQDDCPWRFARAARDFFKDFGVQAPENPHISLACKGMKAWYLRSGSFLSPWRGSRRSKILNMKTS